MHLMRSKKLINTWVAEQVWPLPSLSPIPSQNSQLLNEMGPKLGNGTSPCFFTFLRGGVWQVIPKYFYFSEKTFCFLYMQYPSKKWCKTTYVTVLLSQLQMQLWTIHKQGCTAFWKLMCVWTQHTSEETSDSQKKPFILRSSCATNARPECALNVSVILYWHVLYIRYLGMQLPAKLMHVWWYILCRWIVVMEPDELGVSWRDLAMQSALCKDEKMECKLTQDERAACVEGIFYSHQQTLPIYLQTPDYAQGIPCA